VIRFFLVLSVAALAIAGIMMVAIRLTWIDALPSFFYRTILFLMFATFVVFRYLYKADKSGFFVQLYLLTMAVKFIAYGVFNVIVIREDPAGAASNVAFFIFSYLVFTALEVVFLYRKISHAHRP